jgi:hypothetical protein
MRIIIVIALIAVFFGCKSGGSVGPAIAVATMAASMSVVQMARAKDPRVQAVKGDCLVICGPCEVPCGNSCLSYGSICYSPPGKACAETGKPEVPKPEPPESCPVVPGIAIERSPSRSPS